jgi:hypothetical protein
MKTLALAIVIAALTLAQSAVAQGQQTLHGYLFSKLAAIGTRSEGPAYFLQTFDDSDVQIKKHALPFQDDPALRAHLGTKVIIVGTMKDSVLDYTSVAQCPTSVHGCVIQWGGQ